VTSEQRTVAEILKALPARYRVKVDTEGWPYIAARYGRIEFDGVVWTVYSDRPRLFRKLGAVPGVRRHQTGDDEARMILHHEALAEVARVIGAKKRRAPGTGRSAAELALMRITRRAKQDVQSRETAAGTSP
jgi:hypothetical protein